MSKTKEEVMESLWSCCRLNRKDWVKEFLDEYPDQIDFYDPMLPPFGIVVAHNYAESLEALIDFYTKTRLQYPKDSMQYKTAFIDLQNLLYDAQDGCSPSEQIREMIEPYLSKAIDTTSERDEITEEDKHWSMDENDSDATTKERSSDSSGNKSDDHPLVLPMTMENLEILRYPYWQLNLAAEENERKGNHDLCVEQITNAAKLVVENPNITSHLKHKTMVIYNYLRFTGNSSDELLNIGNEKNCIFYANEVSALAREMYDNDVMNKTQKFVVDEKHITSSTDCAEEIHTKISEMSLDENNIPLIGNGVIDDHS